jgi:flagellar basal-body rod modification protein FlgD
MTTSTSVLGTSASQAGTAASTASSTTGAPGSSSAIQDQFLKLLITQMRNQDPLNPMDNAQMTTQMAQMSSLQGIEKLNTTLESLAASLTGNQAVQAATLVGHDVMVPGNQLQLAGGHGTGGVALAQAADQVQVTITDASGTVVHHASLGAQPQGIVQIDWDGMTDGGSAAAAGPYQFTVTATAQGQAIGTQALTIGHVHGVTAGSGGTSLDLGAQGSVSLSQVWQFL